MALTTTNDWSRWCLCFWPGWSSCCRYLTCHRCFMAHTCNLLKILKQKQQFGEDIHIQIFNENLNRSFSPKVQHKHIMFKIITVVFFFFTFLYVGFMSSFLCRLRRPPGSQKWRPWQRIWDKTCLNLLLWSLCSFTTDSWARLAQVGSTDGSTPGVFRQKDVITSGFLFHRKCALQIKKKVQKL